MPLLSGLVPQKFFLQQSQPISLATSSSFLSYATNSFLVGMSMPYTLGYRMGGAALDSGRPGDGMEALVSIASLIVFGAALLVFLQRRHASAVTRRLIALGRETALDAATIKGVVDRLARQGLVSTFPDPDDRRRLTVDLSEEGRAVFLRLVPTALEVSARTLGPLSEVEQRQLLDLLMRLA
mgnify:CR=1 FL=1